MQHINLSLDPSMFTWKLYQNKQTNYCWKDTIANTVTSAHKVHKSFHHNGSHIVSSNDSCTYWQPPGWNRHQAASVLQHQDLWHHSEFNIKLYRMYNFKSLSSRGGVIDLIINHAACGKNVELPPTNIIIMIIFMIYRWIKS